jgi:hypothetical protein
MNKDEFANLANSKNPSSEAKDVSRKVISNVLKVFSDYTMYARDKYPNTVDSVAVGSSGDGLSAILSFGKDSLRYAFDNDTIVVWFSNTLVDTYTFDGANMLSKKHKHQFDISDVEQELNNFK